MKYDAYPILTRIAAGAVVVGLMSGCGMAKAPVPERKQPAPSQKNTQPHLTPTKSETLQVALQQLDVLASEVSLSTVQSE